MMIKGSDLTDYQREQVLAAFVHRHTVENAKRRGVACILCHSVGRFPYVTGTPGDRKVWEWAAWHAYHVKAVSDRQWLQDHAFHFVANGSRLALHRHAEPAYMAEGRS